MKFGIQPAEIKTLRYLIILLLLASITFAQLEEGTSPTPPAPPPAEIPEETSGTQIIEPTEETLSPPIESAGNLFSRGLSAINAFFTGEGIKAYSRIIDFIVFFIIFTTVFLIGLRAAFKDKGVSKQITALAVALGIMSTLALMFGGTFLGKPITIVSLFPFILWFLIGFIPFAIIYWILHLLMKKKHPILAFFIALIIAGVIVFLIYGIAAKIEVPGAPAKPGEKKFEIPGFKKAPAPKIAPIKGHFKVQKSDEFVNDQDQDLTGDAKTRLLGAIEYMGKNCKVAMDIRAGDDEYPHTGGVYEKEEVATKNRELAKARCNFFIDHNVRDNYLDEKGENKKCEIKGAPAYKILRGSGPNTRSFKLECKEKGGYEIGKGPGSCDQLTSLNVRKLFGDAENFVKDKFTKTGKDKLDELDKAYKQCEKEKDVDAESLNRFYEIVLDYRGELAKQWFEAGKFVEALTEIKKANKATGGVTDDEVTNSAKRTELLKLWYEDLVFEDLEELTDSANKGKKVDPTGSATQLIRINNERERLTKEMVNKKLEAYNRP